MADDYVPSPARLFEKPIYLDADGSFESEIIASRQRAERAKETITWADGFGIWHVKVPKNLGILEARMSIESELRQRSAIGLGYQVAVEYVDSDETHAHYKEI